MKFFISRGFVLVFIDYLNNLPRVRRTIIQWNYFIFGFSPMSLKKKTKKDIVATKKGVKFSISAMQYILTAGIKWTLIVPMSCNIVFYILIAFTRTMYSVDWACFISRTIRWYKILACQSHHLVIVNHFNDFFLVNWIKCVAFVFSVSMRLYLVRQWTWATMYVDN